MIIIRRTNGATACQTLGIPAKANITPGEGGSKVLGRSWVVRVSPIVRGLFVRSPARLQCAAFLAHISGLLAGMYRGWRLGCLRLSNVSKIVPSDDDNYNECLKDSRDHE